MDKKEFAAATLDSKHETYVVHIAFLKSTLLISFRSTLLNVNIFQRPQISDLIVEEAATKVPTEYSDFIDVFFPDLASELLKYTGINDHTIELVDGQQPLYKLIYSLGPVELET